MPEEPLVSFRVSDLTLWCISGYSDCGFSITRGFNVVLRRIENTSPLILLSNISLLDLLRAGDLSVIVPQADLDEIARHGPEDQSLLRRDPLSAGGTPRYPMDWTAGPMPRRWTRPWNRSETASDFDRRQLRPEPPASLRGLSTELIPARRKMATKCEDVVKIGFVRCSATAALRTQLPY